MTTTLLDVPGISCSSCAARIEKGLSALDGVNGVSVDVPAKRVSVEGDAEVAALLAALADLGYPAAG